MQNSIIDALQFVAKAHEILIGASLSAIVLHRILYDLAMKDGTALATLTPAYQLSQPRFMFKWEFWREIFGRGRMSLGILMTVAVFLMNVAAPSAAIAIIPKSGWWPVPSSILWSALNYSSVGPFYITNSTPIWPDEISVSYLSTDETTGDCLSSFGILEESCPAAGYLPISKALLNDGFQTGGLWSVLLSDDDIARSLVSASVAYFEMNVNRNRWSITSSVSQIMASSMWNYNDNDDWKLGLGYQSTSLLKPLVQVECAVNNIVNSTLVFPHSYIPFPGLESDRLWTVNGSAGWDSVISQRSSDVHFLWADLPNNMTGPSLLAAFNVNNTANSFNFTDENGLVHSGDNQTAFTCSIDARWAPVQMWMLPGNDFDYRVHEESPYDLDGSLDFLFDKDGIPSLQQIQIDPSWAASLNVDIPNSTTTLTMEQIIRIAAWMNSDAWSNGTSDSFLNLVATGIGMMITDGLARVSLSDQLVAVVSDDSGTYLQNWGTNSSLDSTLTAPDINPAWLELDFSSYRQGWSYSLTPKTVKFALAVLLLHFIVAVVHTGIVVGSRHVWVTKSWKSMGELLVLAINSDRTDKLQNTCAGVGVSSTWRKTLKIRETRPGHLGLVVDDNARGSDVERSARPTGEKPMPGRRYGRVNIMDV